jgi:hypothetical protein
VVSIEVAHEVVPSAVFGVSAPTFTVTRATLTLSDAVPETVIAPETVAPAAGAAIVTEGAVVSRFGRPDDDFAA